MIIIINGSEHVVSHNWLDYDDIVKLVKKNYHLSVVYKYGFDLWPTLPPNQKREGTLSIKDGPIPVRDGMVLNAMDTGNA